MLKQSKWMNNDTNKIHLMIHRKNDLIQMIQMLHERTDSNETYIFRIFCAIVPSYKDIECASLSLGGVDMRRKRIVAEGNDGTF